MVAPSVEWKGHHISIPDLTTNGTLGSSFISVRLSKNTHKHTGKKKQKKMKLNPESVACKHRNSTVHAVWCVCLCDVTGPPDLAGPEKRAFRRSQVLSQTFLSEKKKNDHVIPQKHHGPSCTSLFCLRFFSLLNGVFLFFFNFWFLFYKQLAPLFANTMGTRSRFIAGLAKVLLKYYFTESLSSQSTFKRISF